MAPLQYRELKLGEIVMQNKTLSCNAEWLNILAVLCHGQLRFDILVCSH